MASYESGYLGVPVALVECFPATGAGLGYSII